MVRGADDPNVWEQMKARQTMSWLTHVMQDFHEHNHDAVRSHWQDLDDVSQQDVFELMMHMLYAHHMAPQSGFIVLLGSEEADEESEEPHGE
jgi:hypothetical protein